MYDKPKLIGLAGVDVYRQYRCGIWPHYFTILPQYRKKEYGKKVLLVTIEYCKKLNKFDTFRVDTTYWENRPALFLYNKVMLLKK